MAEVREPSDVLVEGVLYTIGDRVYYVKKWTVRMVLVDVPQIISRFYERLKSSGEQGFDYGNLASALQMSANEVAYLIGKSLEPNLTPEEVMELPAEVGADLLRIILEQNIGFFVLLTKLFRGLREKFQGIQPNLQA